MNPVDQIHVGMTGGLEHGTVPRSLTSKCVACLVVLVIRFYFNDPGAQSYAIEFSL